MKNKIYKNLILSLILILVLNIGGFLNIAPKIQADSVVSDNTETVSQSQTTQTQSCITVMGPYGSYVDCDTAIGVIDDTLIMGSIGVFVIGLMLLSISKGLNPEVLINKL